jgi:predicted metal-dependent hydrolase
MPPQAFWQGVEEFNQEEFYACHDTLEALWMEAPEPEKRFYQGVLQVAVAFYHLGNFNWRGAVILLGEGIRKLSDYQPVYHDIDVSNLIIESSQLLTALQKINQDDLEAFVIQLKALNKTDIQEFQDHDPIMCSLPKIIKLDHLD